MTARGKGQYKQSAANVRLPFAVFSIGAGRYGIDPCGFITVGSPSREYPRFLLFTFYFLLACAKRARVRL
jgi:hypothetical protein